MPSPRRCTTDGTSVRIAQCALSLSTEPWSYAQLHREDIAAHWQRARAARPKLFDGPVHVLTAHALHDGAFTGTFARTDFKSFLYWREQGAPGPTRDGFGSSLIRSSDGCILLGLQSEGNLNAGCAYPPSGLIEPTDTGLGSVDIDGSIARELEEETGLAPAASSAFRATSSPRRARSSRSRSNGGARFPPTRCGRASLPMSRASPSPSSPTS